MDGLGCILVHELKSLLFSMCNFIAIGLLQQSVCMLAGCLADKKVKLSSQHVSWSRHKKFGMLFV